MSSGMNCEQAKEYAKTMTYRQAVGNVMSSKGIKYRKATMIKLRELAEIADRLDRKTEPNCSEKPNNCETCRNWDTVNDHCYFIQECRYEPKTEPQKDCKKCKNYEKCKNNKWKCCVYQPIEDEPRTDYRITDTIGYKCPKCGRGNFLNNESNCVYCGEPLIKTDCAWGKGEDR